MAQDTDARFFAKLSTTKQDQCWEWTACISQRAGYGLFWDGDRLVSAHRWSHERFVGPIPPGLYVCHHCDNRRCVNPEHLYAATQSRNILDCSERGRLPTRRGEASNLAKLTDGQVVDIRARYERGERQWRIAEIYSISQPTVSEIVNRKLWAHL